MSTVINIGLIGSTQDDAKNLAHSIVQSTGVEVRFDAYASQQGMKLPAVMVADTQFAIWVTNDEPDPNGGLRIFGQKLATVIRSCYMLSAHGIEFQALWACSFPSNVTSIELDSLCDCVLERRIDENTRYVVSK